MLKHCFHVIEQIAADGVEKALILKLPVEYESLEYPLFVTWQNNGTLRGCIGTFKGEKLSQLLT